MELKKKMEKKINGISISTLDLLFKNENVKESYMHLQMVWVLDSKSKFGICTTMSRHYTAEIINGRDIKPQQASKRLEPRTEAQPQTIADGPGKV